MLRAAGSSSSSRSNLSSRPSEMGSLNNLNVLNELNVWNIPERKARLVVNFLALPATQFPLTPSCCFVTVPLLCQLAAKEANYG